MLEDTMKRDLIYEYCLDNGTALNWYMLKKEVEEWMETLCENGEYVDSELDSLKNDFYRFTETSNLILNEGEFLDWFMYYVENQLSIFYFALKDFKETNSYDRLKQGLEETKLNTVAAYNNMNAK